MVNGPVIDENALTLLIQKLDKLVQGCFDSFREVFLNQCLKMLIALF